MQREPTPFTPSTSARQSLAEFLRRNRNRAIAEWERAVRAIPGAALLDTAELRDHVPLLMDRVLELVESGAVSPIGDVPDKHALERLHEGFNLEQLAWEYSALRSTWLRLNDEEGGRLAPGALIVLNDAIDRALVRSVARFHRVQTRLLEALDLIAREGLLDEPRALDALLHRLLRAILESTESVDTAVLFLSTHGRLVLSAGVGLEQELEGKFSLAMGEGFAGKVAATRRPLFTPSAETDPLVRNPVLRMAGVKALYGVPLVHCDEVIGVVKMGSRTASDFAPEDRQILRSTADRAAAFIAQRRMAEDRELLLLILGHDLRSPLSTILLGAGSMLRDPLPPETARKLDHVLSAARRMDRVIGDLTDYTKRRATGTLQLDRENVDLRELVAQVAGEVQAQSENRVKIDCAGDATGQWDRSRLLRVIVNLVNNALAYGAPSTPVDVHVEGDEAWAALRVHNEGEPIAADLLPHLFEAFTRGTKGAGSGLGLHIVQEIVQAHGGEVTVESTRERGTTFTVRLPRRAGSVAAPGTK